MTSKRPKTNQKSTPTSKPFKDKGPGRDAKQPPTHSQEEARYKILERMRKPQ